MSLAAKEWGRLLSVEEAEALTGRKKSTWRRDILERKVPIVRIGRQVKIPLSFIEELVQRGYRPAVEGR